MSLDLYLYSPKECPHCGGEIANESVQVFWQNYTHNVTPMWRKAGVLDALYESDGHKPSEYLDALRAGVAHMESVPAEYIKLNPANGWGSYETALPWLKRVLEAFEKNPNAIIGVSR